CERSLPPYPWVRLGGSLPAPGSDVLNIRAEFGSFLRREKADKVEHRLLTREPVYHVSEALLRPLHRRQLRVSPVRDGYVPRAHCYTHMCVYRRLLTPSGNMFHTGQQTGSVVIAAGQISQSFATSAWNVNLWWLMSGL